MSGLGREFNFVTMFDVLEHLETDVASLEAVSARWAADGRLLLTVPALPFLWLDHDRKLQHFRRYTALTLRAAIEEPVLKFDRLRYFNALLFPVAVTRRLVEKLFHKAGDDGAPINGALRNVFAFEGKLVNRMKFPVGLSLYAIVRR